METEKVQNDVLVEQYPFIREDIKLCAWVEKSTNIQRLVIEKIDLKTGGIEDMDSIKVRNLILCEIPVEEFERTAKDSDFKSKMTKIRASQDLKEIHLAPREKFKSLKSWVSGIAEAGLNALRISSEDAEAVNKIYPILTKIVRFLMYVDIELIFDLIRIIERESLKEGVLHERFLKINLTPIIMNLVKDGSTFGKWELDHRRDWTWDPKLKSYIHKNFDILMPIIMELNPSEG
jgi:hypothetical protein